MTVLTLSVSNSNLGKLDPAKQSKGLLLLQSKFYTWDNETNFASRLVESELRFFSVGTVFFL